MSENSDVGNPITLLLALLAFLGVAAGIIIVIATIAKVWG